MNREIKFRGKRVDNGEWVEGNLINCASGIYILETDADLELRPEYHSQGMGCGLEDRNITDRYDAMHHGYESAVNQFEEVLPCYYEVLPKTVGQLWEKSMKQFYTGDLFYAICSPSGSNEKNKRLCKITFNGDGAGVGVWYEGEWWGYQYMDWPSAEIIGNIHDNPELIKAPTHETANK